MRFHDRYEAGRLLAEALNDYTNDDVVVYALPRGGVVTGVEIAKALQAPLDLIIPRKIGHPLYPEYAICAVTEDGHLVCNREELADVDKQWLDTAIVKERAEAKRRRLRFLADRQPVPVEGKTAIITDDGIATGLTMIAAIQEVKDRLPARVVLAVPIIPQDAAEQLERYVDVLVALDTPAVFLGGVGAYYDEFEQVSDEEVLQLLSQPDEGVMQQEEE